MRFFAVFGVVAVFFLTAKARRARRFLFLGVGFGGGAMGENAFEKDGGRFVIRALGHQFAAEGLGEDGLTKGSENRSTVIAR